jgi:antitoxin VapB
MTVKTRLFMSGRSQAVRLPAKVRLQAEEVCIEKLGDGLWIQPEPSLEQNMGDWLRAFYNSHEPFPDDFLVERDASPPQQRDWS